MATAVATPAVDREAREKALRYNREGRIVVRLAGWGGEADRPGRVEGYIRPAPGDRSGISVRVDVTAQDGVWECTEHPGENTCGHRLALQNATGWGELGGRWRA